MSTITHARKSVNSEPEDRPVFHWGADEIAAVINRSPRPTYHLLSTGQIKSARHIGGKWCAPRHKLLEEFGAQ